MKKRIIIFVVEFFVGIERKTETKARISILFE